jgi:hypothetical protein
MQVQITETKPLPDLSHNCHVHKQLPPEEFPRWLEDLSQTGGSGTADDASRLPAGRRGRGDPGNAVSRQRLACRWAPSEGRKLSFLACDVSRDWLQSRLSAESGSRFASITRR